MPVNSTQHIEPFNGNTNAFQPKPMKRGVWYAIGSSVAWGLFPVYWKQLGHVPALQLTGHRIIWSFLILITIVIFSQTRKTFATKLTARVLNTHAVAVVLLGINWSTYVWAVNAGFIVEASLGYFITPLVSVGLGVLIVREKLRQLQWASIGLASTGVLYLTVTYGALPWLALTLAASFGVYGLIKKKTPLGSIQSLTVETGILFLPALGYLTYTDHVGQGSLFHDGQTSDMLLVCAGAVTTLPLLLFAAAVQRMPLSFMGVLQYVTPTLQFLVGVIVYKEPFTRTDFTGYSMVWAALIIFGIEGFLAHRLKPHWT